MVSVFQDTERKVKPRLWSPFSAGLVSPTNRKFWDDPRLSVSIPFWDKTGPPRDYSRQRHATAFVTTDGTPTWDVGEIGLRFPDQDGPQVLVSIPDDPSLTSATELTLEVLFRMDSGAAITSGDFGVLGRKRSGGDNSYQLLVNESEILEMQVDTGATPTVLTGAAAVNDGLLHHAICRWGQGTNELTLDFDGVREDTDSDAGTISDLATTLEIGGATRDTAFFDPFPGVIYLYNQWDRRLSNAETHQRFANPWGPFWMQLPFVMRAPAVAGAFDDPQAGTQRDVQTILNRGFDPANNILNVTTF